MTSDIAISARPMAHSRFSPSSGASAANPAAGEAQLADPPRSLAKHRMILLPRISPGPRNQEGYDMCCGKGGTHQEAPNESFTCTWGTPRQKSDHVILRHFCDWLLCSEGRLCPRPSLLPERAVVRGGDGATTRQIARGSGRCRARNSANARRTRMRGSAYRYSVYRGWRG
jgi:hypothetical protein